MPGNGFFVVTVPHINATPGNSNGKAAMDRIFVIAGGRVAESGTRDELQAIENGVYQRLAALQFRE